MKSKINNTSFSHLLEGWDLFDTKGSTDGDHQICKIDEVKDWAVGMELSGVPIQLSSDQQAIKIVHSKALEGSEIHREALALICLNNPQELRHIFAETEEQKLGKFVSMDTSEAIAIWNELTAENDNDMADDHFTMWEPLENSLTIGQLADQL